MDVTRKLFMTYGFAIKQSYNKIWDKFLHARRKRKEF